MTTNKKPVEVDLDNMDVDDLTGEQKKELLCRALEFLGETIRHHDTTPQTSISNAIRTLDKFEAYGNDKARHAFVHSLGGIGRHAAHLADWLSPHVRHICEQHASEHMQDSLLDRLLGRRDSDD